MLAPASPLRDAVVPRSPVLRRAVDDGDSDQATLRIRNSRHVRVENLSLGGSVFRPMRFVMWYKIFQMPVLKFFFRQAKAIPIASAREDKQLMDEAFEKVDAELAAGNVVCIFPEGGITRDGEVQRFRPGIEKVIQRRAVPVVPAAVGRLWGSWLSRRRDGSIRLFPRRLFARVPVTFGKPVPPGEVTAAKLELLVRTLRGDER